MVNWDKRNSQMSNSAPRKCSCGAKLSGIVYETPPSGYFGRFRKRCPACVVFYEWSYPNVWQERSELELFDSKRILPQLFDFYGKRVSK
jgi:hypothetical protein